MRLVTMDWSTFVPDFSKVGTLVIFASFILAFAGVEASASHVNELKNPGRNYPLAMFILVIVAIVLDALGGLAVAITLPPKVLDGNLSYGVIEAFRQVFVVTFGEQWGWLVYAMAVLLALGVLAESLLDDGMRAPCSTRPSRASCPRACQDQQERRLGQDGHKVQAGIVTIWDAVLCGSMALSGGSSSSVSYLTAIGLTVVIYLVAYVLLFVGYLVLVLQHQDPGRTYQIPGGKVFKTIVAVVGLLVTLATLVISFFPSSELDAASNTVYVATLIVCFLISLAIPFVTLRPAQALGPQDPGCPCHQRSGRGPGERQRSHRCLARVRPTCRTPLLLYRN